MVQGDPTGAEETIPEPSKEELARARPGTVDTDSLLFDGLRGDRAHHLARPALEAAIASLPAPPRDAGVVSLMVARGPKGERQLPREVILTREGGMPGDRWASQQDYGPDYQLATTRTDIARLIANGQALELHGDNLFLSLDLSADNLPIGSTVRLGEALLCVTPTPHNGCKKWVQRFGLAPMQLNLAPEYRTLRMRGLYLRVLEDGRVRAGDPAVIVARGCPA